jgi:cell division protein ZapB
MTPSDPVTQLQALAERFERLAEQHHRVLDENRSLRQGQEQLVAERAALLNKNEQARSRVEAMITRLKSLEHNA